MTVFDAVRAIVPRPLRPIVRSAHRKYTLWRTLPAVIADPACLLANSRQISDLLHGWGNESFSPGEEYIRGCVSSALTADGPILECGSGLTTLLLGAVAQRSQTEVWTLEHDQAWSRRVTRVLSRYGIRSVRICLSPLRDYGEFTWYAPPLEAMPSRFSLVVCDGPPGDTPGGRYGLVPIMKERLTTGCKILLDDAVRTEERSIAARWALELRTDYAVHGSTAPYIELGVPSERPA